MFKFKPYITVIGENGLTVDFELSQLSTFMINNIDIDNGLIWCNEVYIETKAIDLSVLKRKSSRFKLFADIVTQIILHPYRTKSKSLILHLDTDAKVIHNKNTNTMIISNLSEINNEEKGETNG